MDSLYRFGSVEVLPAERQLRIDGRPADLGARALDILLALVEHRDRVVTKDELMERVWPGLVVEENNLQVHISALRKLLGPQAISTVPGLGYKFTLPLDDSPRAAATGLGKPSDARPAGPQSMNRRPSVHQHERRQGE